MKKKVKESNRTMNSIIKFKNPNKILKATLNLSYASGIVIMVSL